MTSYFSTPFEHVLSYWDKLIEIHIFSIFTFPPGLHIHILHIQSTIVSCGTFTGVHFLKYLKVSAGSFYRKNDKKHLKQTGSFAQTVNTEWLL